MERFQHQVAGHDNLLVSADGQYVYKPVTWKELEFYQHTLECRKLQQIIPRFYGQQIGDLNLKNMKCKYSSLIKLENLAFGFDKPCIADIKVGSVLFDQEASSEKKERMKRLSESTTSGSLGIRFTGMKIWSGQEAIYYGKEFGKCLTKESISKGFDAYFQNNVDYCRSIPSFVQQLISIQSAVEALHLDLHSCSVLLIYDADFRNQQTQAKLIDFAHSRVLPSSDNAALVHFLFGMTNLIELLKHYHPFHQSISAL